MSPLARVVVCAAGLLSLAAGNFVSPGLGKCMDIKADKKDDGTRETLDDMKKKDSPINVQLYTCHEKHNQNFEIVGGMIKSASLGRCVTAVKAEANSNVQLEKCKDGSDLQQWDLTGYSYAKLKGTSQCIDVKAAEKEDGTREKWDEIKTHTSVNVQLFDCHDPSTERVNQLWEWAPVSGDKILRLWAREGPASSRGSAGLGSAAPALAAAGGVAALAAGVFVGRRTQRRVALAQADSQTLE